MTLTRRDEDKHFDWTGMAHTPKIMAGGGIEKAYVGPPFKYC